MANVPFVDDREPINLRNAADGPLTNAFWNSAEIYFDNFKSLDVGFMLSEVTSPDTPIEEIEIKLQLKWDVIGGTQMGWTYYPFSLIEPIMQLSPAGSGTITEHADGYIVWDLSAVPQPGSATMILRLPEVIASHMKIICEISDPKPDSFVDNRFHINYIRKAK